jgi:hypothetical protein
MTLRSLPVLVVTLSLACSGGGSSNDPGEFTSNYDGPVISQGGWQWRNPLPQGTDLNAIWAKDAKHVWAAGEDGTILLFNGKAWELQHSEHEVSFHGIWGTGTRAVWAVGHDDVTDEGVILFWNGERWSRQQTPATRSLRGVWAWRSDAVWAVGDSGILFFNGHGWAIQEAGISPYDDRFFAVSGVDSRHVWAVTEQGVWSFDGHAWRRDKSGTAPHFELSSVWAYDPEHVWVARWDPYIECDDPEGGPCHSQIWFFDGRSWEQQLDVVGIIDWRLHGVDAAHVWATGGSEICFFDGHSWSEQASNLGAEAVFAISAEEAWAVGSFGATLKLEDGAWQPISEDVVRRGLITDISGTDRNHVWVVGELGSIFFWNGQVWQDQSIGGSIPEAQLSAVWAADLKHAWTSKFQGRVYAFDGDAWTEQTNLDGGVADMDGTDASHVWAVGKLIHFFDGTSWQIQLPDVGEKSSFVAVKAFAPDAVWAVNDRRIFTFDGTSWQPFANQPPTKDIDALWGLDPDHVWVGTFRGQILYWNGSKWALQENPSQTIASIWGTDESHVWAASYERGILFFDGDAWSELDCPIPYIGLWGVWTPDRDHAWAIGYAATILSK